MDISCIILAGGKSQRLGRDKITEKIGNQSLLEHVISRVAPLSRDIIIVTAEERSLPQAGQSNLKVVSDIFPGKGSLGGIYTGLTASGSFSNFAFACDMPFLNQSLLRYMTEVADGFDCVLPRINGQLEPLHAIYTKDCLPGIASMLREGRRAIHEFAGEARVRYVEAEEIERFDPRHLSFFNINTKEDLEKAKRIVRGDRD